ncbi:hypothetical protein CAC42_4230 [Sphaceloma murrayae]|uniref:Uncharacterized protein n=1 Tax=Sphaceloma murrayae TaxID=2082308 RepID=A0A2K1QKT6_9PEZI|nr:hypothetical protein CAC42_4230 [Sphaceloma murrayae]
MVFDYFSFARAKKNTEELEKKNPQNPVLKDEDEQFLQRVASQDVPEAPLPPSIIKDDGTESLAQSQSLKEAAEAAGTVALPSGSEAENTDLSKGQEIKEDAADQITSPKRTWASYVPSVSVPSVPTIPSMNVWRSKAAEKAPEPLKDKVAPTDETASQGGARPQEATATDEAGTLTPTTADPSKESTASETPQVDENLAAAYPPGVKVTEDVKLDQEKKDQDVREVSVLLDRLNLSSINNRVFSFSDKSQKLYEDFTVVLKDMINGGPTAYHDMEKLLRDNESHLSEMFSTMPPFVQTLVKSLPAKLGSSLGPEILAAASEKPGADMKARMSSASKSPSTNSKKKSNVPSVKGLANEKGAIASMLKSIVTFLQTRFPAIITGTNVIMSLAVFILLFVFWYCHKRGRETRLLKEADATASQDVSDESGLDESQILTPESSNAGLEKEGEKSKPSKEDEIKAAEAILSQPEPAQVPLPVKDDTSELQGEKLATT